MYIHTPSSVPNNQTTRQPDYQTTKQPNTQTTNRTNKRSELEAKVVIITFVSTAALCAGLLQSCSLALGLSVCSLASWCLIVASCRWGCCARRRVFNPFVSPSSMMKEFQVRLMAALLLGSKACGLRLVYLACRVRPFRFARVCCLALLRDVQRGLAHVGLGPRDVCGLTHLMVGHHRSRPCGLCAAMLAALLAAIGIVRVFYKIFERSSGVESERPDAVFECQAIADPFSSRTDKSKGKYLSCFKKGSEHYFP